MSMPKNGFTLIELSIVLVIIGLVIGGIMVGKDLVHAAEVRAQIAQFAKFSNATNAFKIKYNAVPGDIYDPDKFGFSYQYCDTGCPWYGERISWGNGDGKINDYAGNHDIQFLAWEPYYFFINLSEANMIDDRVFMTVNPPVITMGQQCPMAKIGHGCTVVTTLEDKLNFFLGMNQGHPNPNSIYDLMNSGTTTASDSYNIDKKIDDGAPLTGTVRPGLVPGMWGTIIYDTNPGSCITSVAANSYNVTSTGYNCSLLVRSQ